MLGTAGGWWQRVEGVLFSRWCWGRACRAHTPGTSSEVEGKAEGGGVAGVLGERCHMHSSDESTATQAQPCHLCNSAETGN